MEEKRWERPLIGQFEVKEVKEGEKRGENAIKGELNGDNGGSRACTESAESAESADGVCWIPWTPRAGSAESADGVCWTPWTPWTPRAASFSPQELSGSSEERS